MSRTSGPEFAVFEGASSGLLDQEDLDNAAEAIAPDSAAGLLVYENRWAAPFAVAMRRGGGQLVASGASRCKPSWRRSTPRNTARARGA